MQHPLASAGCSRPECSIALNAFSGILAQWLLHGERQGLCDWSMLCTQVVLSDAHGSEVVALSNICLLLLTCSQHCLCLQAPNLVHALLPMPAELPGCADVATPGDHPV